MKSNPKDFVNICFWIFASILAFKTYINAKKTLFNPIRSEMVKYQMKVITEFIDNHTSKGFGLDFSVDYVNLAKINYDTDYLLDILINEDIFNNHDFEDTDNVRLDYCKENLAGLFEIIKKQSVISFDSTVIGDFDITRQYVQTKLIKEKEKMNKDLPLQRFYFTKKFYSLYSDLLNLETNPFIPEEIKISIKNVTSNILKNLQLMYEILAVYISSQKATNYQEMISQFNTRMIKHDKDLEELRSKLTVYFKVNKI